MISTPGWTSSRDVSDPVATAEAKIQLRGIWPEGQEGQIQKCWATGQFSGWWLVGPEHPKRFRWGMLAMFTNDQWFSTRGYWLPDLNGGYVFMPVLPLVGSVWPQGWEGASDIHLKLGEYIQNTKLVGEDFLFDILSRFLAESSRDERKLLVALVDGRDLFFPDRLMTVKEVWLSLMEALSRSRVWLMLGRRERVKWLVYLGELLVEQFTQWDWPEDWTRITKEDANGKSK